MTCSPTGPQDKRPNTGVSSIFREFRPQGSTPLHMLLATIIQPRGWSKTPHSSRPFPDLLRDWDDLVWQRDSKEVLSDSLKRATIMSYAPEAVRLMLRATPHEHRTNHGLMRQLMKEQHVRQAGLSYVPSSRWREELIPMDVGAKGWGKPKRRTCGKLGHLAKDCWWSAKRSKCPKGKGKGEVAPKEMKGQGKGKEEKWNFQPPSMRACVSRVFWLSCRFTQHLHAPCLWSRLNMMHSIARRASSSCFACDLLVDVAHAFLRPVVLPDLALRLTKAAKHISTWKRALLCRRARKALCKRTLGWST